MQKICALILLSALVSNHEALPQTKWSRPIRNPQGQLIRERRQFPFGEWIPLNQACPTCRPFADPLDVGLRSENIGLTPPRPPTVTRQIHGEGNFFSQDESSILSVPPPPPSAIPRHPVTNTNGNFQNLQFSSFGQQFNSPLPTQQIFPQTQQVQFLSPTFLPNQQLLVNNNQPILQLNGQNTLFGQENQGKITSNQQTINGKVPKLSSEFKAQKLPENVVLEQNNRQITQQQSSNQFSNKPKPFTPAQTFGGQQQQQQIFSNQQQSFGGQQQSFGGQQQSFGGQQQSFGGQQQSFGGQQQQHSLNFGDSILTPPPAPKNATQNIVIPGLDKEEIQLLYVPVETLRQRGNFQEQQLLTQQPQNIHFQNRPSPSQRPVSNLEQIDQTTAKLQKGHFITQNGNGNNQGQSVSTLKVTSSPPFPTTVTPSSLLLQQLPFHQTPQPFVSATPATPTIQPFVTPSSVAQKFSSFTPETTLSHLVTIPNSIQFSQSDIDFGTTPKTFLNQGAFQEQIINGKTQFGGFKDSTLQNVQEQQRPLQQHNKEHIQQSFVNQQQQGERQPQQNTVFLQEQQKELDIQNHIPNQQLIDQQQIALQKQQEQQRLLQQQKEKELEEQYLQKQRQQKELEAQRLLQEQQKQKELEEQRLLQQKRQKELEEQKFLQQQRQKELEEQKFLQQQRQKELEQQRFLQQQREKELENQRRLQLQRQKEIDEKRRLQQIKQREEEQRLLILQQQQKELEEQRLFRQQQEEQRLQQEEQRLLRQQQEEQRLLRQQQEEQQQLLRQKQENLKKQQQIPFFQQQPKQQLPQTNRHILPANDQLNSIAQLEKESEQDQQLVPHQPPLSVFYKGFDGADAQIIDVLRELRSSRTITVLDQYFEKMPKVFVGPAGLIPPAGYKKFELPYLSNLETNRIERRIDRLPFFVAPLNFVPPPGYSKIPFPAPHVGSVVVSSESNPAMKLQTIQKETNAGFIEENVSESFPMVGPELPGLINSLETETTTIRPTSFPSTPSLPQTTAQLRNRRPNSSLYKTQTRKPISKTRPQTTSKPEEEVTQPFQKTEVTKEPEGGFRKPFNRFLHRRRQQGKTTTESPEKNQQDVKNLENKHYSVEVYHQQKNTNQLPRTQLFQNKRLNAQSEQEIGTIDRSTPGGHGIFEVSPTPSFYTVQPTGGAVESEEHKSGISEYSEANLQTFEDGPLPTGSAKTITQELYRPNTIGNTDRHRTSEISFKYQQRPDSSEKFKHSFEEQNTARPSEDINPAVGFVSSTARTDDIQEIDDNVPVTPNYGFEKQEVPVSTSEKYLAAESPKIFNPYSTPESVTVSEQQQTEGFGGSDEQYTSAFAEISKHHHIPGPTESSRKQNPSFSNVHPTPQIAIDLQAPYSQELSQEQQSQEFSQEQHSQEFLTSGDVKPTQNTAGFSNNNQFDSSNQQQSSEISNFSNNKHSQEFLDVSSSPVSPTAPGSSQEQYTTGFSVQPNSQEFNKNSEAERRPSFIGFHTIHNTPKSSVNIRPQYFPTSTAAPQQEHVTVTENFKNNERPRVFGHHFFSVTPHTVTENPSTSTHIPESISEDSVQINGQQQTTEDHGQNVGDNLSNTHRLKLPNPSIVRVRTRVRGKPRGQVNFAASQSTTLAPIVRSKAEQKNIENTEQEYATKTNTFQPIKTSKYNQYRGLKKPVRTTTEATTESEQKTSVYTIRPPRRLLNPSTVSTKRIRRPTTPISTVESATGSYPQSEDSQYPPSGVSNDVYYEHTSLTPIRQKFRKHFGSAEPKSDFVPVYSSTAFPSTVQSYTSTSHDEYAKEEVNVVKDLSQIVDIPQENSETYPEWNPSESGFDVSGIVLTTIRTPNQDDEPEIEEPKKTQDIKKAFDPDLEKKSGRRRIRVRVHKRPHENFEFAESQNLRTVANVLVPPTSTYKPSDENNFHQLNKNSDFSLGGQKLFGSRSREYFRKRLNLTQADNKDTEQEEEDIRKEEQSSVTVGNDEPAEKLAPSKSSEFLRGIEKDEKNDNEFAAGELNEGNISGGERIKVSKTKFRGYIRKVVKHKESSKEVDSESAENEETEKKHQNSDFHSRQHLKANQDGFNQTGRLNGTRHRTFVRYVKKNKIRPHDTEKSTSSEVQEKGEEGFYQTTESVTQNPEINESDTSQQTVTQHSKKTQSAQSQFPVYHNTEYSRTQQETRSEQQSEKSVLPETIQSEVSETEQPEEAKENFVQTTQEPEQNSENIFHNTQAQKSNDFVQQQNQQNTGLFQTLTQRPKFYQSSRPVFQRQPYTGFQRARDQETHSSTSQQTPILQEKRDGPLRSKYVKTTGYGATGSEKLEELKKAKEQASEQQINNKNLHTLEVRKYLRTKHREGAFSQFSKNKYYTSEKTELSSSTSKENNSDVESEEFTTPIDKGTVTKNEKVQIKSTSIEVKPQTTEVFAASTDSDKDQGETTKVSEELHPTTTEPIENSTEQESTEDETEITSTAVESTTEAKTELPTTLFQTSSSEPLEISTESKSEEVITERIEAHLTETEPDLYSFSKSSFSFDEAEKFTGTKNRAHVRNITADIIENTASFSAPGVEKRIIPLVKEENSQQTTEARNDVTLNQKTEQATTEYIVETTTVYPEHTETETAAATEAVTKAKIAKLIKTSTTTKISHETEICYKGKCIRTKSENPDDDLKKLVDSANIMKIEKSKT